MKGFLLWLRWKLFWGIELNTCTFVGIRINNYYEPYQKFLRRYYTATPTKSLRFTHPANYKQMRRQALWRFLVKRERG